MFIPDQPDVYQGKQVIINSDRLLFNAKTDSILLFSDKAIGFSTNGSFHFDTGDLDGNKFVVNAPDIYLGLVPDKDDPQKKVYPTEPALLGDKTEEYLNNLLDMIENIIDALVGQYTLVAPIVGPCAPFGGNEGCFGTVRAAIGDLRSEIEDIKSKRIKIV